MSNRDELRQRLQKASVRKYATVAIGDDEYTIQSLTLREKGENETMLINAKTGQIDKAKMHRQKCDLLCRSVVDADKQTLFEPGEWEMWSDVSSDVTSKLLAAIDKLNDGKEVEGLLGN